MDYGQDITWDYKINEQTLISGPLGPFGKTPSGKPEYQNPNQASRTGQNNFVDGGGSGTGGGTAIKSDEELIREDIERQQREERERNKNK